jgi:hypothetical protein
MEPGMKTCTGGHLNTPITNISITNEQQYDGININITSDFMNVIHKSSD